MQKYSALFLTFSFTFYILTDIFKIKMTEVTTMEYTLLKKLEMLWGIPIFYTDNNSKKIQSFATFSEKENPLATSVELTQSLIEQVNSQKTPVIYKILNKIYFGRSFITRLEFRLQQDCFIQVLA